MGLHAGQPDQIQAATLDDARRLFESYGKTIGDIDEGQTGAFFHDQDGRLLGSWSREERTVVLLAWGLR